MEVLKSDIDSLLPGDKQYVIPVFQRFYEWPKERLENLWEDILALIEDNPKAGSSHFIGPMVHMLDVKKTNQTSSVRHFIVVDGQQRLMSIFVLICAVRDHAIKSGYNPLAKSIEQKNYISLIDNYGKTFYKIQPRLRDRDTLISIFENKDLNDRKSLLIEAYQFFRNELEKLDPYQPELFDAKLPQETINQLS